MNKLIAMIHCLVLVGCAAPADHPQQDSRTRSRPAGPNLDRTYEWGSRTPGVHLRD